MTNGPTFLTRKPGVPESKEVAGGGLILLTVDGFREQWDSTMH